ncbi:MAG: acyl-CoA dehydrogenase family protein [Paracoccus sp. (in: a-proteobacteria)]|uniref:acyl-CoA dehydrogenase family protein n=1 Tax=Paracoccus sp. TaxID=267 RepID=UPI0026DF7CA3|nr:acyl-CoA dehydrogenase family protein [Paracoccus sp. (in: a-proteobacteria)]MDO5620329.1 acyl-CoA dehydrogenase family protein [Paracoccus sp. (in: a-proteobacteria)]
MSAFHAPVDDILTSLRIAARGLDWDADTAAEIIGHFAGFAEGVIGPLDETGDVQGCRLDGGRVRMPDGFGAAYAQLAEGGWQGLRAPEAFGGMGLDPLTNAGVSEIFSGANHSLQMVTSLVPGAVEVLTHFGTPDQQARLIPRLASGELLATMALSEPGAGSDLAAIRTKATPEGDHWRINGEKIFISGGDQDMSAGILHLVLARSGGEGVKGLSLFLSLSEWGGVSVTRIEEKMGLHASPTCQLAFDGARAELIGTEGGGLRAMFAMMNHARLDVALQGVAHAARAADLARRYAADRRQGRGPDGQPVTIDQHSDVARMIAECDRLARAGRHLCHLTLAAIEAGDMDFVEFMTPVCKYACTEGGIRAADLAIQVMGGYGYLREYGAEQNWRDARICAIYEGANGIHARATASRGITLNGGAGARAFAAFLTANGIDAAPWQAEVARLASLNDTSDQAHDFMELTARLALDAAMAGLMAG